ncbi:hypothetical protein DPMN_083838 [Dreissena polymorpha]|uniref:Uncharacterized protein n=1 Tax=Dreissena polymorpha TaxID=45954 RepID=A0A9D3YD95_DREPO|nr:hypothetical protein DPMN_083838 [Dreissena polymorpha]
MSSSSMEGTSTLSHLPSSFSSGRLTATSLKGFVSIVLHRDSCPVTCSKTKPDFVV